METVMHKKTSGLARPLLMTGILWLIFVFLGHIVNSISFRSTTTQVVTVLTVALLGTLIWKSYRPLRHWLTAASSGVSVMIVLLIATICGTIIVQGQTRVQLEQRYGESLAGFFRLFLLDDVFHAMPFRGFLGIMAVSLVLVTFQRKVWRVSEWGFLLSHTGVVIILIGGLIGSMLGMKGFIDLHAGQTAQAVTVQGNGNDHECNHENHDACGPDHKGCQDHAPKTALLGFGLRLDKFEIDRHPVEYRFYVYEPAGEDYRVVSSHPLKDTDGWTTLGKSGQSFRLIKAYPDFVLQTEVREAVEHPGLPMLQLRISERDGRSTLVTLVAGSTDRDTLMLGQGRTLVRFLWELNGSSPAFSESLPERHAIEFRKNGSTPPETVQVKVGETYRLSEGEIEVTALAYFPDFAYDTQRREGYSRSTEPKNPAIKVGVRRGATGLTEERWLFAKMPDYGQAHGAGDSGQHLTYHYLPAREPAERELIVVGKDREVMEYRKGVLTERHALPLSPEEALAPQLNVACERLLERGEELTTPLTRSSEWRRPMAEIEIKTGDTVRREFLAAGTNKFLRLADDKTVLVFDRKPDDIKSFQSTVSILNGKGDQVLQTTLAVNDPLSYGGYSFYQSNYRKEDPTYSGILVVKDPGLPLVYTGFTMACLGVIYILYLRPVILKRQVAAKKGDSCLRLPRSLVHTAWF